MSAVERRRRRAVVALLATTAITAAVALATSLWLTFEYRPSSAGSFGSGGGEGGTHRLTEINEATFGVLSGLALVLAIAGLVPGVRDAFRLSWRTALAGAVVLAATWLAGVSRSMLEWDQLALRAVVIDSDVRGYWAAAFDDAVRFVLDDGTEVSQPTYAAALAAHLTSLLGVLGGLGLAAVDVLRRDRTDQNRRSSLDSMPRSSS